MSSTISIYSRVAFALMGILVAAWCLQIIVYLLSPFSSAFQTHYALVYIGAYLLLTLCSFFVFFVRLKKHLAVNKSSTASKESVELFRPNSRVMNCLTVIVLLGLLCHLYDKFIVRNIQPTWCISSLRTAWLNYPRDKNSIATSIWSAIGHLGIYFSFPAAFFYWTTFNSKHRRIPIFQFLIINCALLVYSLTIGSRSVILMYLVFTFGSLVLTKVLYGRKLNYPGIVISFLFMATLYATILFYNRVSCNKNTTDPSYIQGYFRELLINQNELPPTQMATTGRSQTRFERAYFLNLASDWILSLRQITRLKMSDCSKEVSHCNAQTTIDLIFIYLNHGVWNFETALHQTESPESVLLSSLKSILNRMRIITHSQPPKKRSYGAGSICLVGAIWYDLKVWGLVSIGIIHGLLMNISSLLLIKRSAKARVLGVSLYMVLFILNALSPWAFAFNFMAAPFVVLSSVFCLLAVGFYNTFFLKPAG